MTTIFGKVLNGNLLVYVIDKIKSKKELINLDDEICVNEIKILLKQEPKLLKFMIRDEKFSVSKKAKEIGLIVKEIRKRLRTKYGLFQTVDVTKTEKYIDEMKSVEDVEKILKNHVSTEERFDNYTKFYSDIFRITGKPKTVFDIGCGYNPYAYKYLGCSPKYFAIDLNYNDMKLLQKFFDKQEIKGKAINVDLSRHYKDSHYDVDVVLALKLFDILDNKIVEWLVVNLKYKWMIATFPTKTICKARMNAKRRSGFQKMLRRLGMEYQTLEFENELVYLVRK